MTTTAPGVDTRAHRTAIVAAIAAAEPDLPVYDYGKTPAGLPPIFALLGIERRFVEPTNSGLASRSGWRVTIRYVGRTVDEARWAELKVANALDGARLTVSGFRSTPVHHESSQAVAVDEGRYSGFTVYTYAL